MGKTLEQGILERGDYDRIIVRRATWDGCIGEQEFDKHREQHLIPVLEVAHQTGVSRRYRFHKRWLERKKDIFNRDQELDCAVYLYQEEVPSMRSDQP